MCFKAAPGIRYLMCYDLVQEPEKVFCCEAYPNGKDCKDPKTNHSVTAKEVREYCPNCVAAGKNGFIAREKELVLYDVLQSNPHPNIVRRLNTDQSDCLFLERVEPLKETWLGSSEADRRRWARGLLSALSWLEKLGWAHGDLGKCNMGILSDDSGKTHLKLFDFGSAYQLSHEHADRMLEKDHFDLATCLRQRHSQHEKMIFQLSNIRTMDGPSEVEAQLPFNHAIIGKGLANGAYANGDRMAPAAFDLSLLLPQEPILRHLSDVRTIDNAFELSQLQCLLHHSTAPLSAKAPPTGPMSTASVYVYNSHTTSLFIQHHTIQLPHTMSTINRTIIGDGSAHGAYTNGYRMAPAALDLNLLLQHKSLLNQLAAVQTMDNASEMEAQLACRKQQKDLYELARAISRGEATEDDERAAEAIRSNHRRRRKRPPTKTKEITDTFCVAVGSGARPRDAVGLALLGCEAFRIQSQCRAADTDCKQQRDKLRRLARAISRAETDYDDDDREAEAIRSNRERPPTKTKETTAEDEEPLPKTKETIDEDKKDAEAIRNRDFLIS